MRNIPWTLICLLSLTSSTATASLLGNQSEVTFEKGFYGALSLGATWSKAEWDGVSSISLIEDNSPANSHAVFESWTPQGDNNSAAKILGNVAFGYQIAGDYLYLGGEISGTFRDKQNFELNEFKTFDQEGLPPPFPPSVIMGTSQTQSIVSLNNNEFDIDIKPGIFIYDNFLVYARAGAAFTKLKIKNSGIWTEMVTESDIVINASDSSQNSKNVVGFRAGAGFEFLVAKHIGVSFDYIYTNYGSIDSRVDAYASNLEEYTYNQVYGVHAPEVEVSSQVLMAGVTYHF